MSTRSIILAALAGIALAPASVAEDAKKPKKGPPTLEERCREILKLQTAVHDGIAELRREIARSKDKKASPAQKRAAVKLAKKQKAAADEIDKALKGLDASAVAFAEVLREVRKEMHAVQRGLERGDISEKALVVSVDVVGSLNDILRALTSR